MALDRLRRWPTYITVAIIVLLFITLLNSWGSETDLLNKLEGMAIQLNDCNLKQDWCVAEKELIQGLKDDNVAKVRSLERDKTACNIKTDSLQNQLEKTKSQANRTSIKLEICMTDLQQMKNLQTSKSSVLESLRLQKKSLTSKVKEYEQRILDLEKALENFKNNGTLKTPVQTPKILPTMIVPSSPQPVKSSLSNFPLKEPALENNAKEVVEEMNVVEEPQTS